MPRPLRRGYTTGSCAAAAAKAAALLLFSGTAPDAVSLAVPEGTLLHLAVEQAQQCGGSARCCIRKDAGDDPDVTDKALIFAEVRRTSESGLHIDGGEGIGRVTLPGLDQPVGAAAINRVPRQMIRQAVQEVAAQFGYPGGLSVVISIPEGTALAKKTYNSRLGIVGGLSVLGTSGIVEPMSEQALIDTIAVELRVLAASGATTALITPGNYGESFLCTLGLNAGQTVKCANFIGDALDLARQAGFSRLLLVGHLGKLVKVAGGILNTHSKYADARMEILAAHAALCGAPRACAAEIMACVTTDEAVETLARYDLREPVLRSLCDRIGQHLALRAGDSILLGAVVFSNRFGLLGKTVHADALIKLLKETETTR